MGPELIEEETSAYIAPNVHMVVPAINILLGLVAAAAIVVLEHPPKAQSPRPPVSAVAQFIKLHR